MRSAQETLIFEKLRTHLQSTRRDPIEMGFESKLIDLGVDSMGIITILLMLEKEVGIDFDKMIGSKPPKQVNDLVALAVQALPEQTPAKAG